MEPSLTIGMMLYNCVCFIWVMVIAKHQRRTSETNLSLLVI